MKRIVESFRIIGMGIILVFLIAITVVFDLFGYDKNHIELS